MKKDEIRTVVKNAFKKINKLFPKVILDFDTEDIQQFRMEIRKLGAFFHLLDMEGNGTIHLRITRKMKTFYGYIGIIRNIQLHLKKVNSYCQDSMESVPVSYTTKLEKDLEYWKKQSKEFMDFHNNFYNDEDHIISVLPDKLRKGSIEKFARDIIYKLQKLLIHSDDETLDSTRKLLEDTAYNWASVQAHFVSRSACLSSEEGIESLIEMLAAFRDKCIDVILLQTYYDDSADNDKMILQKIIHTWKIQKQELRQIIYEWLDLIQLRLRKEKRLTSIDTGND